MTSKNKWENIKGSETQKQIWKRHWNFMRIGKILQPIKLSYGVKNGIQERLKIVGLSVRCRSKTKNRD